MSPSRQTFRSSLPGVLALLALACGPSPSVREPTPLAAPSASALAEPEGSPAFPGEDHLSNLRQLSFGGENAEAYWSFDGRELIFQSKRGEAGCDRIYRMSVADPKTVTQISSGKGATTCSYFFPGDKEVLFASTHLGGNECPPPPDRSQGYVWALYPSYDIFKTSRDGGALTRLTDTPGYDAEATVCAKDGSIVFTSVRDGDLELYRMDADGKNVRRLTNTVGYDGGAFFNQDCTRIVWRASRPKPGKELEDYKALLAQGLVRPTKLELYVANADGSEPVQVTYLDAASFAPFFHPSGKRILFSSNYGDEKGREFDIFAINDNGTGLERVTHAPGFDGFPMFSPDGKTLAFASNRATPPGAHDTNVFVARYTDGKEKTLVGAADRVFEDIARLAAPAEEGRGVGTQGLTRAGAFIEERFKALGLTPAGDATPASADAPAGTSFRQSFSVPTELELGAETKLRLGERVLTNAEFVPLGFSPSASEARGDVVFAGYGVVAKELKVDDYAGLAVKNKLVLVRRFVADDPKFQSSEAKRRYGDLRYKAWVAKQRGARALIIVDEPALPASGAEAKKSTEPAPPKDAQAPAEAPLPKLTPEGYGDAGIPVVVVKRAVGKPLIEELAKGRRVAAELVVKLSRVEKDAFNVVGRIPAGAKKLPGVIVIGAHYDHLGFGGRYSLAPDNHEPHVGADDNASGTAVLLEIARTLSEERGKLGRDIVIAAFSGEESGLLGSSHFIRVGEEKKPSAIPPKDIFAMLNLDMVGRLRDNRVQVLGTETAKEWPELLTPACDGARLGCALAGDGGYGPSDQMSFFVAKVPVLHFFTGTHADYHKPSDTADKINAGGAAQIGKLVSALASTLSTREPALTLKRDVTGPAPRGDLRSFNASLGTIPDYAGPGPGKAGVLLGGVRPGGAAERAGLRRGDLLVRIGKNDIRSIEDLMFVLNGAHPGETTSVGIVRDGKMLSLEVTFQEGGRR